MIIVTSFQAFIFTSIKLTLKKMSSLLSPSIFIKFNQNFSMSCCPSIKEFLRFLLQLHGYEKPNEDADGDSSNVS